MDGQEITYVSWELPQEFTEVFLIPVSDIHKGNPFFSEKHCRRTIDFITRKPNAYWVGNGDWMEAAIRISKGDVYGQTESPKKQISWCKKEFKDIASKGLGFDSGNHEGRIYDATGLDPAEDIAEYLDVPYSPEGLLMKISFGGGNENHKDAPYVFWVYMSHGYGGARTKAAKAKKVEDQSHYINADCHLMSHDHVVNVSPAIELNPDNRTHDVGKRWREGNVKAKRVMLVKTSAYLKWGGYSQRFGYPPSDLTTPVIKLMTPKSPYWEQYPEKPKQCVKVDV